MIGIGTIINTIAVITGGTLGLLLGSRLSERMRQTVMHGLGLVVLVIGIQLASQTEEILIVLGSVLIGGVAGELLRIEGRLNSVGRWLEQRTKRNPPNHSTGEATDLTSADTTRFSQAFLMASLVFCVGPMAILGSFQDGLSGDYKVLAIKSMLDFFAAMAFASTMGAGVIASTLTVAIYQGALTLGARWISGALTDPMITEMTATGGVLMLGIGLGLLKIKDIRTGNLLPALAVAPIIVAVVALFAR